MIKIFHNPQSSVSKKALALLQDKDREIVIIDYMTDGINENTIMDLARRMEVSPKQLIRKVEPKYQSDYKGKDFDDSDWARIIMKNPELLERPIVVGPSKTIIARPPELILKMLNEVNSSPPH